MAVHYWSVVYLFLLQLVIPTLKSHAATRQLRHVRAHCEQTFQDGVFFIPVRCVPVSCFLCCCRVPLQPQFRQFHRELLLIFVCIAKIRQVLTSLISPFALFRAFCVVVEFHSSHSFANFSVLTPHFRRFRGNSTDAVLLLSSTPATVFAIFFQVLSSSISSFASCVQCCVVVEFHSSHSHTYAYANSRPHIFSFAGWRKPPRPFRLRSPPP
jgi:hypothetical protein